MENHSIKVLKKGVILPREFQPGNAVLKRENHTPPPQNTCSHKNPRTRGPPGPRQRKKNQKEHDNKKSALDPFPQPVAPADFSQVNRQRQRGPAEEREQG